MKPVSSSRPGTRWKIVTTQMSFKAELIFTMMAPSLTPSAKVAGQKVSSVPTNVGGTVGLTLNDANLMAVAVKQPAVLGKNTILPLA